MGPLPRRTGKLLKWYRPDFRLFYADTDFRDSEAASRAFPRPLGSLLSFQVPGVSTWFAGRLVSITSDEARRGWDVGVKVTSRTSPN